MGKAKKQDLTDQFGDAQSPDPQTSSKKRAGSGIHKPRPMHSYQGPMIDALYDENMELAVLVGAAGTGKTFLAINAMLDKLQRQQVKRIILARPAVEAGEKLGHLPGDMKDKVAPYMQPFFDIFAELGQSEYLKKAIGAGTIEIAPVAFMRGRTLVDCGIVVDEAQNLTATQLDMVTTRIGHRSQMALCGDPRQSDLANGSRLDFSNFVNMLKKYQIGSIVEVPYSAPTCRASIVQRIQSAREQERLGHESPAPRTS